MKVIRVSLLITVFILVVGTALAAADEMSKTEACKLLGNCADDAVSAAEQMRIQCGKMMEAAKNLTDKGMQIKTRGQMWADKDMVTEGDAMVSRGTKMMEDAKKMDEQCKLIIDEAKKTKQKADQLKHEYDKNEGKKDEPKL